MWLLVLQWEARGAGLNLAQQSHADSEPHEKHTV